MLMTRQEILDKLKEILVAADSGNKANILYMVIAIEEAFGIYFDDVGVNSFSTVGEVIDYIEGKLR